MASRIGRTMARASVTAGLGVVGWYADREFNASTLARNTRTLYNAVLVGIDFKLNFPDDPTDTAAVDAVHARVAKRIFDVCHRNGMGLDIVSLY
jgi:aarF domain-containing kinase